MKRKANDTSNKNDYQQSKSPNIIFNEKTKREWDSELKNLPSTEQNKARKNQAILIDVTATPSSIKIKKPEEIVPVTVNIEIDTLRQIPGF